MVILVYGIGIFAIVDGLMGIIFRRMWTFMRGGGGPIGEEGRAAVGWGIFYFLGGVVMIFLGSMLKDMILPR